MLFKKESQKIMRIILIIFNKIYFLDFFSDFWTVFSDFLSASIP